jgi:pyridoxal phosphate enzyme (YggS family)
MEGVEERQDPSARDCVGDTANDGDGGMNERQNTSGTGRAIAAIPNEQRERLAAQLRQVRTRIGAAAQHSGRTADAVQLVAVTKTVPAPTLAAAYELGLTTFGENRVQEARAKQSELALPGLRWELIGHLQTNKAGQAVSLFDRVQSVDSLRLAEALSARAAAAGRHLPILLEFNVAGEASKTGFAPDELIDAARTIAALPALVPQGLMTVAPIVERPEDVRPIFRELRELRDRLRAAVPLGADAGWRELSMGMSDDFEVAIEEGATLVRLGRALFGDRDAPPSP